MQGSSRPISVVLLSAGERSVFLKHMAYRLLLTVWAIYALIFESLSHCVVSFFIGVCLYGMGEIVFSSMLGMARQHDRNEKARLAREAAEAARLAKQAEKADKANYFDAA